MCKIFPNKNYRYIFNYGYIVLIFSVLRSKNKICLFNDKSYYSFIKYRAKIDVLLNERLLTHFSSKQYSKNQYYNSRSTF